MPLMSRHILRTVLVVSLLMLLTRAPCFGQQVEKPGSNQKVDKPGVSPLWKMHLIDDKTAGGGGPDGLRLLDVDGDGDMDGVSGWESSDHVRLYLNPGPAQVRNPWKRVEAGVSDGVEDAVLCDMDEDGFPDIVSSGTAVKGENAWQMQIHWAPSNWKDYADGSKWTASDLTKTTGGKASWYAIAFDADQNGQKDIFTGKGWFRAPDDIKDVRDASKWSHCEITSQGRPMSMHADDVDGDGDTDYIITTRYGNGVCWYENPLLDKEKNKAKGDVAADWTPHPMIKPRRSIEHGALVDFDADGDLDMVVPIRNSEIGEPDVLWLERTLIAKTGVVTWVTHEIVDNGLDMMTGKEARANNAKEEANKGLAVGDIDLDGKLDVAINMYDRSTSANPKPTLHPSWFSCTNNIDDAPDKWVRHQITDMKGKFDRCDLIDLDADGDLDFITSNEVGNWVLWYENPLNSPKETTTKPVEKPTETETPQDTPTTKPSANSDKTKVTEKANRTQVKEGENFTVVTGEIEMIFVEEGIFMMGQPGTKMEWIDRRGLEKGKFTYLNHSYHSVTLTRPYWIGKYEVTQKEWKTVMGDDPSFFTGERRPVERISWFDAKEYCEKLTAIEKEAGRLPEGYAYRLPTEAEWENAAKGGVRNKEEFEYSGSNNADEVAWYNNGIVKETHDVGEKKPNQLGIYDMSGNVWEWTLDFGKNTGTASSNVKFLLTDTYVDGIVDPLSTQGEMPVRRGGSWKYGDYNCNLAVYNRRMLHGASRKVNRVGFRIVLAVDRKNEHKRKRK